MVIGKVDTHSLRLFKGFNENKQKKKKKQRMVAFASALLSRWLKVKEIPWNAPVTFIIGAI